MIIWHLFDWPSFATLVGALATLVVGMAAVVGAYRVGIRQAGITERQADIMDRQARIQSRQVSLEEASLKASLFERRLAVYDITSDYLENIDEIAEDGQFPRRTVQFFRALQESRFLFRPEVHTALSEIADHGGKMRFAKQMIIDDRADGLATSPEHRKTMQQVFQWAIKRQETLHEVFAPDLELSSLSLRQPAFDPEQ